MTTLVFVAAIYAVLIAAGGALRIRLNLTPSEPLGIWRIVPLDREVRVGDIVFICPPDNPLIREARSRGYLRNGLCKGGYAPLIKTVIALPGQRVSVGSEVEIDGLPLPSSHVSNVDSQGRTPPVAVSGPIPDGAVFLYSDYPGSFDSRYFGPLEISGIQGLAQAAWTGPSLSSN